MESSASKLLVVSKTKKSWGIGHLHTLDLTYGINCHKIFDIFQE